jgi:hypothetical protein
VRGSPLIRFFLLFIALVFAGVGLMRLTSTKVSAKPISEKPAEKPVVADSTPYHLILSSEAAEILIDTGIEPVLRPTPTGSSISGNLALDPKNPHFSISVRWKQPTAGEHRFAKITLEPAGQPTFTHVFDSSGDIDELLELPLAHE